MRREDLTATRLIDLMLTIVALPLVVPLLAGIAVLVKTTSRGPVLYCSVRVGRHGRLFRMYKFRTMRADASGNGPQITSSADPRITGVGHRLRRWKLDELPQLINVLRGDMSLVGPRPEVECFVDPSSRLQQLLLSLRPGMTSPASLIFSREEELLTGADLEATYRDVILPTKLAIDSVLATDRTIATYLRVIGSTVSQLLFGRRGDYLADPMTAVAHSAVAASSRSQGAQ